MSQVCAHLQRFYRNESLSSGNNLSDTRMFSHDVDIGSRILCCAQGSFIMKLHVLKCLDVHVSLDFGRVKLLILGLRIKVNNFGNVKFL